MSKLGLIAKKVREGDLCSRCPFWLTSREREREEKERKERRKKEKKNEKNLYQRV